jgi:protein subunit release factor A
LKGGEKMTVIDKIEELEHEIEMLNDKLVQPKCAADFEHNTKIGREVYDRKRLAKEIELDALNAPYYG